MMQFEPGIDTIPNLPRRIVGQRIRDQRQDLSTTDVVDILESPQYADMTAEELAAAFGVNPPTPEELNQVGV